MPNKKITVVGDGAEQPLTPEEEHRLEVRVDQMMDPNLPDDPAAASSTASNDVSSPLSSSPTNIPDPTPVADPDPVAVPDSEPVSPPTAETESESQPEPETSPEPEPKKVTKIMPTFADDESESAPAPAKSTPATEASAGDEAVVEAAPALPVAEVETPKPVAKPAAKKIAVRNHDDDDEAAESAEEAPKPKTTKTTASKTKKPKKAAATKKAKAHDDNLETKADAIAAAALAAAEQMQAKTDPEKPAEVEPEEPEASAEAAPKTQEPDAAEQVPDLPTTLEADEHTAQGAPPLIQKHSAAPLGAAAELAAEDAAIAAVPTVGKKINIVDNSGAEPEVTPAEADETEAAAPESDDAERAAISTDEAEPEAPVADAEDAVPPADPQEIDETETAAPEEAAPGDALEQPTPAEPEAAAATESEASTSETKKYRPPEGPIQFKRAEVPIEPYKPGTGPRPTETTDDISSEDAAITQAFETKEAPRPKLAVPRPAIHFKALLMTVLLLLVVALLAVVAIPSVRNIALALAGVKGDVRVTVLDAADNSPLSGATVTAGSSSGTTDADGTVSLHAVKLGNQQLTIRKYAFADKSQSVNVTWHGTNSAKAALTTTGQHYHVSVVDYLSGQPIKGAKLTSGQSTSLTDAKGNATLVAPTGNPQVTVTATGYSQTTATASSGQAAHVSLAPAGQDVYIARGGGKFNVYRNTLDGRNEQLVLSGAAASPTDLAIAPNASGETAALVSTRDNTRDSSGNLGDSLTLITVSSGKTSVVDHADTIKLVDWFGKRLVYVLSKTTTSTTDDQRYQLVSYDTASGKRGVLDHAAYLNDVVSAKGVVYYATAATGNGSGQFVSIKPDGTGKKVILSSEIAAISRSDYNQLALASVNKWYRYRLGDGQPTATSTAISSANRHYVDSPNGLLSAYVDSTSGSPKLMLYNVKSGKTTQLTQAVGITYPLHWLGNGALVYRVSHSGVVTDNVVSPDGGNPKVITAVSDFAGISLWHE